MTDPERFAPLHDLARSLADSLARGFDVTVVEAPDPVEALIPGSPPLPSLRLTPRTGDAAPLTLVFTPLPGLVVRAGLWHSEAIPACGCDDCDETPESAMERLTWLAGNVVSGRFSEAISLPPLALSGAQEAVLGEDGGPVERRRTRLSRREARRRLTEGPRSRDWRPWPTRD